MTIQRWARRADANQADIVDYLRRRWGASVEVIGDVFDILVSWGGPSFPCEIKNPKQPPSKRKLTPRAENFKASYKGTVTRLETEADCDEFAAWARRWTTTTE